MLRFITLFMLLFGVFSARADDLSDLGHAIDRQDCPAIISLIDRGISVGESNFFESMHDTNQHECLKQILQLDRYRNDTETSAGNRIPDQRSSSA